MKPIKKPVSESFLSRAIRNFSFTGLGTLVSVAVSFLFAGFTIRYLGNARAGFFMVLSSVTGINLILSDFGLSKPMIRRIAILNAEGDLSQARDIVGSVWLVSVFTSLLIPILVIAFFPSVFAWSKLAEVYRQDAFWASLFTMGQFTLHQASNPWQSVYRSLERFDILSLRNVSFSLLSNVGGIVILGLFPTMRALASLSFFLSLVGVLVDAYFMRHLLHGIPWPTWKWEKIRSMLKFGGWVYAGSTGQFLVRYLDNMIITTFLGSAMLPYYTLPQSIYFRIFTFVAMQFRILFPMFSSFGKDAHTKIKDLEDRLRWSIALTGALVYAGIAFVGQPLLSRVVTPEFASQAILPLYLACLQGFFHTLAIVPYNASWAVGSGKPNAILEIARGLLVTVTAWFLIPRLGVIGASLAQLWIIPVVIVHTIWVRGLFGEDRWGWLLSLISPLTMVLTWGISVWAAGTLFAVKSFPFYILVGAGGILSLVLVGLIESRVFPKRGRLQLLARIVDVILRALTSRRQFSWLDKGGKSEVS
jgi:O-antigen/teichoic acid export membrane protein